MFDADSDATADHASPELFDASVQTQATTPVLFDAFVQTDQLQCGHHSNDAGCQTDQLQSSHLRGRGSHASPELFDA
eukprot:729232-Karenia_brevis.AAC.1